MFSVVKNGVLKTFEFLHTEFLTLEKVLQLKRILFKKWDWSFKTLNSFHFFVGNGNPLEFRGQWGYSGTSKSGGIGLWLYNSIF